MKLRKYVLVTGGALAVALVLAAGTYLRIHGSAGSEDAAQSADESNRPAVSASQTFATNVAIPVAGAPVIRNTLVISVQAAGQAAAWRENNVLAQVSGRLQSVPVRESSIVGAGGLLAVIDSLEYALQVAEAEAELRRAEAQYREFVLFDDRIADPTIRAERDRVARAKSGLDRAEVQLRRAKLQLARTRVLAPFPGRVANLNVVPGQWIGQNDELMTIVDIDPIKVEVQVLESEVGYLAPRRRASVTFAAFPDSVFVGRIATINPVVDEETRTARVTVVIDNPDGKILPGMYARVALEAQRFPDRILVPRAAILERDRRTMLFVYESDGPAGLAKWRYVTTGLENDSLVEIVPNRETDMVEPGEIVLTDGHYTLVHDAHIRIVENVRAAGGRPN